MPSFLVHQASMKNLTEMLKRDGVFVITGNIIDNIWTDRVFDSHGYSVEIGEGSLFRKIEQVVNEIISMDITDVKQFSEKCRHICHFCTDVTIGQISNNLWGAWDTYFDFCSEFVRNKTGFCRGGMVPTYQLKTVESIIEHQKYAMSITYDIHKDVCRKWNYCVSKKFSSMVRASVSDGSFFSYMWIKYALRERENNASKTEY